MKVIANVTNIKWDIDDDEGTYEGLTPADLNLPSEYSLQTEIDPEDDMSLIESDICDILSDEFNFCVTDFDVEIIEVPADIAES